MKRLAKRKHPTKTSPDPVLQYALDVTSGKEIAGPLVRLACARHIRDLKDGPKRGLTWDLPVAERVFEYFREVLKLTSDKDPDGKPFELEPAFKFIVGSLFGWKLEDGSRRYRVAYVEMGKGNAKSVLGAGVALYMLTGDGEQSAQVYSAAVDKDQAKVSFHFAAGFVTKSELLSGAITKSGGKYGDETRVHNLFHRKSGSYFRPLSSDNRGAGKSGFLPHCVILDELHEHPTGAMVEFVRANTKGRRQPLVLMITNSGVFDNTSVAWQYHEYAREVLEERRTDDEFFFYVCGLDKGDSWSDPKVWKKANPLLGVSIPERYLEQQVREAKGMPSKISLVRRLNFCEWVESADPWVTKEVWDANAGKVDIESLRGRRCFGGLDLSKRTYLTALVLVFPNDDGTKDVLLFAWTPKEGLKEREHTDKAPYSQWVDEGVLLTTPGPTIDYDFVAAKIGELTALYDFQAFAFDHWHFDEMERALNLANVTLKCVDHQQGFVGMNPAIEAAEQDLLNKRLRHGGNALLTWSVFNVKIEKNAAGLRAFVKQKATGRIDPAVSLAMACNLAASFVGEPAGEYSCTVIG